MNFIIKTIYACNLSCIYCYEQAHNRLNLAMSLDDATGFIHKVYRYYIQHNPKEVLAFHWHGGEPMLMGADFFEELIQFQIKTLGARIPWYNTMQTNLTLLDDAFIELLKKYASHLSMGISFDFFGNDRVDKKNREINARVWRNIKRLQEAGIQTNFLTMLTKGNVDHIDEIYDLIRTQEISIRFNQIFGAPRKRAFNRPESVRLRNTQFAAALLRITRRWLHDGKDTRVSIDNADRIVAKIVAPNSTRMCWYDKDCLENHMTVLPDGTVFPCDSFYIKQYSYGNIFKASFESILNSEPRKRLLRDHHRAIEACGGCEFLNYCNGGCPARSIFKTPKSRVRLDQDPLCASHYEMFALIGQFLVDAGQVVPNWASLDPRER